MEAFLEALAPAFLQLVAAIVACIFGAVGLKIKAAYTRWADTQEKQTIVEHTVRYVEQLYTDIHGEEKFEICLNTAEKLLKEKGIQFGKREIRVLIESAVNALNDSMSA